MKLTRPAASGAAEPTPHPTRGTTAGFRLAVLLGAALMLLVGALGLGIRRDHAEAVEAGWRGVERGAVGAAEHASRALAVARTIADRIEIGLRREGLQRFTGDGWQDFAALASHAPEVGSVWALDAAGRVIATSISPQAPPGDFSDRPYFAPLRAGADSYLMPLAWGTVTRVWFFGVNHAVRDADGRFAGVAQASMHSEDFHRVYADLGLGRGARIGLFRLDDGAPLMLWPALPPGGDRLVLASAPPEAAAALRAAAAAPNGAGGRLEARAADGTALLMAWQRVPRDPQVVAVAAMPRATALATFEERLGRTAIVGVLAAGLLAGLAWAVALAQRRAADSEARFRGSFEQAAVGMAHVGTDGSWIRVNSRLCAMLGYDAAELRTLSFQDVTHPDDLATDLSQLSRLIAGDLATYTLRKRYIRKDGSVMWGELTCSLLRPEAAGAPLHFIAVVQDVSDRVAAEQSQAESEARLRRVLDNLFAFVGVLLPDGTLIEANRAPLEAAGLSIEDVRGLPFWDCHWWSHDPALQDWLRTACARAAAGEPTRADVVVRMAGDVRMTIDFQLAPLRDAQGRVTLLIPSAVDVTERRRAEAALAASEQRLALASSAAGMGVVDLDAATRAAVVSAEFRSLYGLPAADGPVPAEAWLGRVHPDDRPPLEARIETALREGGELRAEFRIRRGAEERWVAAQGRAVAPDGGPGRLVGVQYDVTDRRAEQERQMLLAREVDHRAKNVLAVVRSIVRLTRAEDPKRFAEAVEGRVAALARAHTLLARDRWSGAELAEVVREELAAYAGAERHRLLGPALRLKPEAVQPLSIVLHELATNAAKYGALSIEAGRVEVSWELEPAPAGARGGQRLHLSWTERDGPPLAGAPPRRGFGSTVVDATVRGQLGGSAGFAWATEGLRCDLTIPAERVLAGQSILAPPAARPDGAEAAAPAAGALRGLRVLLVEDEPLVAMEAAAALAELGCEVVGPATTLEAALRVAAAEASRLDAAVLDVNLAGAASLPVAEMLTRAGVPVVHVSGYSELPAAWADGPRTLLGKPLRDGELGAALRRAITGRRPVAVS